MEETRQSRGIGSFFFASIFWVIGFGAVTWLSFVTGMVEFSHSEAAYTKQQRYEGRREERVGVNGEILKPVDLIFTSGGCVKIDRAFLDTQTLTLYIRNACNKKRDYVKVFAKEIAPDGTVVHAINKYLETGSDAPLDAGEKLEQTLDMSNDSRTTKIVASVDSGQ